MKTFAAFCLTLLVFAGPLRSQHLQEFNIRDIRPGWTNRGVSLAPYGDGVIAFISQDSTWAPVPIPIYFRTGMFAVTLSQNGIVDSMLLQEDGDFYDEGNLSTGASYGVRIDASDTTALNVLLETDCYDRSSLSVFHKIRSRLLRVQGRTSKDILDIGNAHNARMLRTGRGGRWFVWEAFSNPPDSADGRYFATLKACHISPDGSVGDTLVIGSGYEPILLPDATGNVRLLYRNSWNSRSMDSISLHSALLTKDGSLEDEHTLLRGLQKDLLGQSFTAAVGANNTFHLLWPGPGSLQHFILGPDGILTTGLSTERQLFGDFTMKNTDDHRLVVVWKADGLRISDHGIADLFSSVIRLPETENVYEFSLESGSDGLMKLLYGQGRTIRVFRNPFASAPESVELVAFADSGIVPSSWVFASDGSLWLSTFDRYHFKGAAVYRLASPQLGVQPPRPQSNPLHITGFSPHPVSKELRVGFMQHQPGNIYYFVFDVLGRLRADGSAGYFYEGEQSAHIQLPALLPGAYVLRLRGESATAQRQFLVR